MRIRLLQPRAAGVLLTTVMLALTALPSLARQRNADRPLRGVEARVERLAKRLDLTDAQRQAVRDVLSLDEETRRPGDLWMVAAVLHRDLSTAQRETLFDTARRAAAYRSGMRAGMRRARRGGGSPVMRRASMRSGLSMGRGTSESMQKALGLSEDQVEILRIHRALAGTMGARAGVRASRSPRVPAPAPRPRRGR